MKCPSIWRPLPRSAIALRTRSAVSSQDSESSPSTLLSLRRRASLWISPLVNYGSSHPRPLSSRVLVISTQHPKWPLQSQAPSAMYAPSTSTTSPEHLETTQFSTLNTTRRIRSPVFSGGRKERLTTTRTSVISWRVTSIDPRTRWCTRWVRGTTRIRTPIFQKRINTIISSLRRPRLRFVTEEELIKAAREPSRTPAAALPTRRPISRSSNQHFYLEEIEEEEMKRQIMLNLITEESWTQHPWVKRRAPWLKAEPPKAICQIDFQDKEVEAGPRQERERQMAIGSPSPAFNLDQENWDLKEVRETFWARERARMKWTRPEWRLEVMWTQIWWTPSANQLPNPNRHMTVRPRMSREVRRIWIDSIKRRTTSTARTKAWTNLFRRECTVPRMMWEP